MKPVLLSQTKVRRNCSVLQLKCWVTSGYTLFLTADTLTYTPPKMVYAASTMRTHRPWDFFRFLGKPGTLGNLGAARFTFPDTAVCSESFGLAVAAMQCIAFFFKVPAYLELFLNWAWFASSVVSILHIWSTKIGTRVIRWKKLWCSHFHTFLLNSLACFCAFQV